MSSRRHDSEDSLDLLLDPICNIFGTVMFVALIVAILALTRSGVETLETLDSFSREDNSKLGQLQVRAEELESLLSTLPASEGEELDDAAAAQIERAIGEVAHRQEVVNRYRTVVAATRENLGEVSVLLPPLREEVSRVSDALESARRAKDRQLRTPLEREVALFPFTMLVWHDRLYVLCDLTTRPRDGCEWLRCWDPKYVVAARCSTPVFECSRVKIYIERSVFLRENAGITCDTTPKAGMAMTYTSGCPKNQKMCWYSTGSPPPAALKNEVPKWRSVSVMVTAPASTGITAISR